MLFYFPLPFTTRCLSSDLLVSKPSKSWLVHTGVCEQARILNWHWRQTLFLHIISFKIFLSHPFYGTKRNPANLLVQVQVDLGMWIKPEKGDRILVAQLLLLIHSSSSANNTVSSTHTPPCPSLCPIPSHCPHPMLMGSPILPSKDHQQASTLS